MARAFKETNLQEYKGLQISKGGRDSPGNVVLVQVQAYQIPQVTKLRWDCSLDIIFVKFPVSMVMFNTSVVHIYMNMACTHQFKWETSNTASTYMITLKEWINKL
jgi:hypothetical protein